MSVGLKGPTAALMVVGLPLATACDGSRTFVGPASVLRDSAGVTVVENRVARPENGVRWVVGDHPTLTIGTVDGPAGEQLYDVVDAFSLTDGRIVVGNGGTAEVRVFDASGRYVESWGRRGEGPGEFTDLAALKPWPGDSVLAWDWGQDRVTLFDPQGTVARTVSLVLTEGQGAGTPIGVLSDGSILVTSQARFTAGEQESGLVQPPRSFGLLSPLGEFLVDFGEWPGREYYVWAEEDFMSVRPHPFGRATLSATWGDRLVVGDNRTYEVRAFVKTGELELIVRQHYTPTPVTREHIDGHVEAELAEIEEAARARLRVMYRDYPVLESFPAYSALLADPAGFLWIQHRTTPDATRVSWSVYDAEGRIMGVVETPGSAEVLEIELDHILTLAKDDLGVEYIQAWPLSRDGRTGSATGRPG